MNILFKDVIINLYSFVHDEDKFRLALVNKEYLDTFYFLFKGKLRKLFYLEYLYKNFPNQIIDLKNYLPAEIYVYHEDVIQYYGYHFYTQKPIIYITINNDNIQDFLYTTKKLLLKDSRLSYKRYKERYGNFVEKILQKKEYTPVKIIHISKKIYKFIESN